jgi:hypothetical protein
VVGRHLFATVPVLNLVLALGLLRLWDTPAGRLQAAGRLAAAACLAALALSALSMRFAERHAKDDYRLAAAIAQDALARGQRVWWAADYLGARYYRLPGSFDHIGELTGIHQPPSCADLPGVQATSNLSAECMRSLSAPDLVVFARPETFDKGGDIGRYLQAGRYAKVQQLPAIDIWRLAAAAKPASAPAPK